MTDATARSAGGAERPQDAGSSDEDWSPEECAAAVAAVAKDDQPLPALFLDRMPEHTEDHADLAAMDSMMGELSVEERAENSRQQGNDALKQGLKLRKKFYIRKAVDHYSEGITAGAADAELNSVLHTNRAQAELKLGNNRNALRDAQRAAQLDPANMKAYFRGAKAALEVREFEAARELCRRGLGRQPDFPELQAVLRDVDSRRAAEQAKQRQVAAERAAARAPARALAAMLLSRGWRIGRPQITIGSRKPRMDEDGVVWPVMFIYPESMQNDTIQSFHEFHRFADHLDVMFGPEAPPLEWDQAGDYTRQRVELYYLSHAARPVDEEQLTEFLHGGWPEGLPKDEGPNRYGPRASQWVPVDEDLTLAEVLQRPEFVVPGIPVFFAVPKDSAFKTRFLDDDAFRL